MTKTCRGCATEKPASDFWRDASSPDGLQGRCKPCHYKICSRTHNSYSLKWNKNNRPKINAKRREWRTTPGGRYQTYVNSARLRMVEWGLSLEQFVEFWQKPCYYCVSAIRTIGLDRIDNSQGYIAGNVRPCCKTCNRMKSDMEEGVFISMCVRVAENLSMRIK